MASLSGRQCPNCAGGRFGVTPLSEYFTLMAEGWLDPIGEMGRAIKGAFATLTGAKQVYCFKCNTCGTYAVPCPSCSAALELLGTPSEMQRCSCAACGQDFYVRR